MKQRITMLQLRELSPEQQDKLRSLWNPRPGDHFTYDLKWDNVAKYEVEGKLYGINYPSVASKSNCLPLLSIGQMIELLGDEWNSLWNFSSFEVQEYEVSIEHVDRNKKGTSLCDALWEAVKQKLESQ